MYLKTATRKERVLW